MDLIPQILANVLEDQVHTISSIFHKGATRDQIQIVGSIMKNSSSLLKNVTGQLYLTFTKTEE